ncbi:condensation domain-containing protein [Streptomyces parvus]|uniref:condensation domain-containing protein n=1 Tax=Streptomyces parvus TaxID=66428 RepID=UPI0036CBF954
MGPSRPPRNARGAWAFTGLPPTPPPPPPPPPGGARPAGLLPLRLDLAGDPSFEELADRVRRTISGAEQHQDVSFDDIVRAAGLPEEPGRAPLFDVAYTYRALSAEPGSPPGGIEPDLSWSVAEGPGPGELAVSLDYRTELLDPSSARALVDDLLLLLRAVSDSPGVPLSSLWPLRTSSGDTLTKPAGERAAHTA